jgi:hypothetical protein
LTSETFVEPVRHGALAMPGGDTAEAPSDAPPSAARPVCAGDTDEYAAELIAHGMSEEQAVPIAELTDRGLVHQ